MILRMIQVDSEQVMGWQVVTEHWKDPKWLNMKVGQFFDGDKV